MQGDAPLSTRRQSNLPMVVATLVIAVAWGSGCEDGDEATDTDTERVADANDGAAIDATEEDGDGSDAPDLGDADANPPDLGGLDAADGDGSDTSSTFEWVAYLNEGEQFAGHRDMTVGPEGAIYTVGGTQAAPDDQMFNGGRQDAIVSKYSAAGERLWSTLVGSKYTERFETVAVADNGSVFAAGAVRQAHVDPEEEIPLSFLARIAPSGEEQWSREILSAGKPTFNDMTTVEDDPVITGQTNAELYGEEVGDQYEAFLSRFDEETTDRKWLDFRGGDTLDSGEAVATSPADDRVFWISRHEPQDESGIAPVTLRSISPDSQSAEQSAISREPPTALAALGLGPDGTIWTGGTRKPSTSDLGDALVQRRDSLSAVDSSVTFGTDLDDGVVDLDVASEHGAWVVGLQNRDPDAARPTAEGLVAHLDDTGDLQSRWSFGGEGEVEGGAIIPASIRVGAEGDVYIAGTTNQRLENGERLSSFAAFVARLRRTS